jgi:RNA polymerase-binding transcription factor DksA
MDAAQAHDRLAGERERLIGLREQAAAALEHGREGAQEELSSYDQHDADLATDLHDLEVNQSLVESLDAELAEVDAALQRVGDGTYGVCEACGEAIPDERLEAVPAARFHTEHEPDSEVAP